MVYKVFFSWQSDTDPTYNKHLINSALEEAIKILKTKHQTDLSVDLATDRADATHQPGSPNIVDLIEEKLRECQIFLADVTFVNKYITYKTGRGKSRKKGGLNNNVVLELGEAKVLLGDKRVIKIMNVAYGEPTSILPFPFDIEQDRHPIKYKAKLGDDLKTIIKQLAVALSGAIMDIIRQHETLRKERFKPLMTFSEWASYVQSTTHFIAHEAYNTLLGIAKTSLTAGSVIRVVGLSGAGKTRMVFEALRQASIEETNLPLTQAVLYYDVQEEESTRLSDILHDLTTSGERFIFVIDNVTTRLHSSISQLVSRQGCQSSLITIAPIAESQLPADRLTRVIELTEPMVKSVCQSILHQKFINEDTFTLERVVNYIGAFPALAISLTQQDELNPYTLTDLTPANWVDKVLGSADEHSESRAILQSLSLFTEVGYQRGEEREAQWISNNDLLNPLPGTQQQRWQKFRQIVDMYRKRGIVNTIGRNIQIQSHHLAQRLAEQWWESKDIVDAVALLTALDELPSLRTNFLKQFKHSRNSSTVQETVRLLCGVEGYFTTPESILSPYGSSLLIIMADINPVTVTDCLARLLLTAPMQLLLEAEDGRRNLVWTLEKLCRYEATFETAAQILMRLAVAENESIKNNATGQFLQLFTIRLSGTEVGFPARIALLQKGIDQYNEAYDLLVLKAARAALSIEGFFRMIDPDEQLNSWREYKPTRTDLKSYRQQVIELISSYALSTSLYASEAANILVRALRGLAEVGSAGLVLPILDSLIDSHKVPFKNVRPALKAALRDGKLQTAERELLQRSLEKTEPVNLEEKLDYYVYSFPDPTDYQDMDEATLHARAEALVPEFIQRRDLWEETARNLLTGNQFHSTPFARQLASQLSPQDQEWFVSFWFNYFKQLPEGKINPSPLVGFLASAGEAVTDEFLKRLTTDDSLNRLAFNLIPASTTKPEHLEGLLTLVEEKKQPVVALRHLEYSKLLTESPRELIQTWMQRIATIGSEGLWVALALTWNFIYERSDDETVQVERSDYFKPLIRKWALDETLTQSQGDDWTQTRWSNELTRIVEEAEDSIVAVACMNQLIQYLTNQPDYYPGYASSNAYQPLKALLSKFFSTVWSVLGEAFQHDGLFFILTDLLGSRSESDGESEGLLFEVGDPDILIDWFKGQEQKVQLRFAQMLPIMKSDEIVWHPFTRRMLDTFGADSLLRAEIIARMNTFGSNGSAASLFKMHLILFEQLYQHSSPIIVAWARQQTEICRKRIQWEEDWSDEGFPFE